MAAASSSPAIPVLEDYVNVLALMPGSDRRRYIPRPPIVRRLKKHLSVLDALALILVTAEEDVVATAFRTRYDETCGRVVINFYYTKTGPCDPDAIAHADRILAFLQSFQDIKKTRHECSQELFTYVQEACGPKIKHRYKKLQQTWQSVKAEAEGWREPDPELTKDSLSRYLGRISKELKESKESEEPGELKEPGESKEPEESKELKEPGESKELKEPGESEESKEPEESEESEESKESKESKELKEPGESEESKESKESKESEKAKVSWVGTLVTILGNLDSDCLDSGRLESMMRIIRMLGTSKAIFDGMYPSGFMSVKCAKLRRKMEKFARYITACWILAVRARRFSHLLLRLQERVPLKVPALHLKMTPAAVIDKVSAELDSQYIFNRKPFIARSRYSEPDFDAIPSPINPTVHAESSLAAQLVDETQGLERTFPLLIGCSKRSCLECTIYLELLSWHISLSRSHGKACKDWALPPGVRSSAIRPDMTHELNNRLLDAIIAHSDKRPSRPVVDEVLSYLNNMEGLEVHDEVDMDMSNFLNGVEELEGL